MLGVLGEVAAQVAADDKIDWNALVKKSTTGITNAREYQMLWRHLAYRHGLLDKLDDAAQPLVCQSSANCLSFCVCVYISISICMYVLYFWGKRQS